MSPFTKILCAAALATATAGVHASLVYSNDFSDASAVAGWSSTAGLNFSTPPSGTTPIGQFLGEYGGTQSVHFTLTSESLRHARLTLTLDFLAIRSWDGRDPVWGGNPLGTGSDRFTITANGATLLDESFSNGAGSQSYSLGGVGAHPTDAGYYLPMAGSSAQYALGYSFWDGINTAIYPIQDAIYRLAFTFDLFDVNELSLVFAGVGLQDTWIENDPRCPSVPEHCRYRDESWGIDNVSLVRNGSIRIPGTEIPVPGTLAILGAGLLGILGLPRRRPGR